MCGILRDWARRTDFTASLASSSGVAQYLRLPELRGVPAVVDLVDVDSQKWLDYAAASRGPRSWLYGAEGRRVRRLEAEISRWARGVTLVSYAEARLYAGSATVVRNGVELEYFRPARSATEMSCVFVGALDYRPNVDAAGWFCRHVWPRVRVLCPSGTLYLVGRRPVRAVRRLARLPGVKVIADVPDVRPYLARAAVVVAPLRIARGVQNKVLEALAMGKAVVSSPQALSGIAAEPGVHLLAADTAQDWVNAVVKLFDDGPLRQRLGEAGRDYVSEHHCWERCLEPIGPLLGLTADILEGAACECH
jgi:sugar transferase (PEP-CTERM/EpsH1 system associated)